MDKDYELKNIDSDDFTDILVKIESSFDIKFIGDELYHIPNFGALCDHIANKIQLENSDDCTTQQAFYKLRAAIALTLEVDPKIISPSTPLSDLFSRKGRLTKIKRLRDDLADFNLHLLEPSPWACSPFVALLLASFIGLFFNWQISLTALAFSFFGIWLAFKLGKEFNLETVGQVAEIMAREHYLKSRRNPTTFNKNEIEKLLIDLFSNDLGLDKSKLTREAKFV
jgi:hypothetical protein